MPLFPALLNADLGLFILRLVLGLVFIYHSLPKIKNPKGMAQMMGMANMAMAPLLLGLVEFVAGVGVILGVYTQLAALLLAITMVGAILMKIAKWKVPFAAMDKTGWEFDLVLLVAALEVVLSGGGAIGLQ